MSDGGAHLAEAMRLGQFASATDPAQSTLLIAAYLLAASLPCASTTPSEPILRFAGLAAVTLGEAKGTITQASEVTEWYQRVRGRVRGSIFVPRDVEYAFAGAYEGLRHVARDSERFSTVRRLLDSAVEEAKVYASMKIVDADPDYATQSAERRRGRARQLMPQVARLEWKQSDLQSTRAVAERLERMSPR